MGQGFPRCPHSAGSSVSPHGYEHAAAGGTPAHGRHGTVAAFRAGEPDAVRAVYREYGGLVFAVAYRALGDRSLAEDASQQAFVQAWRASQSFDPSRQLGPWLVTIARRAAIDVHRREAVRVHHSREGQVGSDPPSPAESVSDSVDRACDVWAVRAAIEGLPPVEREVGRLHHLETLTHPDRRPARHPARHREVTVDPGSRRLAGRLGYLREDVG